MAKKVSKKKSLRFKSIKKKISPEERGGIYFVCPNHGRIPREEVIFLCNTCGPTQMIVKGELHLCPQCLKPGENFQCFLCDSPKVEMRGYKPTTKAKK
ncbi:hypothetical protein GTO10_06125 [Candidatus Saccharibacteria bacterium]|nr:hypothetical protein [Candidatus Saccharibacteria bacterium]